PPDQLDSVTEYLIESFPEKPKPGGVTIAGPIEVSIRMWPVPTPGSRPHDPLATTDGAIWYTGQMHNVLGGSIRRPVSSKSSRSRRRIPGRMASSKIGAAISGTPGTPRG